MRPLLFIYSLFFLNISLSPEDAESFKNAASIMYGLDDEFTESNKNKFYTTINEFKKSLK